MFFACIQELQTWGIAWENASCSYQRDGTFSSMGNRCNDSCTWRTRPKKSGLARPGCCYQLNIRQMFTATGNVTLGGWRNKSWIRPHHFLMFKILSKLWQSKSKFHVQSLEIMAIILVFFLGGGSNHISGLHQPEFLRCLPCGSLVTSFSVQNPSYLLAESCFF